MGNLPEVLNVCFEVKSSTLVATVSTSTCKGALFAILVTLAVVFLAFVLLALTWSPFYLSLGWQDECSYGSALLNWLSMIFVCVWLLDCWLQKLFHWILISIHLWLSTLRMLWLINQDLKEAFIGVDFTDLLNLWVNITGSCLHLMLSKGLFGIKVF